MSDSTKGTDAEMLDMAQEAAEKAGVEDPVIISREEYEELLKHRPKRNSVEQSDSSLFEDRTSVAAARQLATVLAWLAECELATLSRYERLASSSKSETKRHREIAEKVVRHCVELGVEPNGLMGKDCPRLKERMKEYRRDEED